MEKFEFEVVENEEGLRLDKFLAEKFLSVKSEINRTKINRTKIQNFITEKLIIDGENRPVKSASQKTKLGDRFSVAIPDPRPLNLIAKDIPFEIVFEDDDLLVINKPYGLTVHPGAGNQEDTLVNALLFTHQNRLSSIDGEFRPGIVHRLDKDTSGLMLVAKNDFTHQILSQKLQDREIKRSYLAFIYGCMKPAKGTINKNVHRSRFNRVKMAVSRSLGREAITSYETKEVLADGFASIIECKLQTGRTHQIRVHLESEKHSLIGDKVYNSCKKIIPESLSEESQNYVKNLSRQALHSYKIGFLHPRSNEEMSFEIDLPADLKKLKECLK